MKIHCKCVEMLLHFDRKCERTQHCSANNNKKCSWKTKRKKNSELSEFYEKKRGKNDGTKSLQVTKRKCTKWANQRTKEMQFVANRQQRNEEEESKEMIKMKRKKKSPFGCETLKRTRAIKCTICTSLLSFFLQRKRIVIVAIQTNRRLVQQVLLEDINRWKIYQLICTILLFRKMKRMNERHKT